MFLSRLQNFAIETFAFTYRNYCLTKNEFYALFEMLFWPIITLFTIGLLGVHLNLSSDEISYILIGIIVYTIVQITQIDVAYVMLLDMWSLSLAYSVVTPVQFYKKFFGAWIFGIFRASIAFVLMIAISERMFNFVLKVPIDSLLLFLLGIFLSAMLVGIFNCILILTFGRRSEIFAWTLSGIIMIFCGIYYPVEILPEPFRTLGLLIPITHFLEYFRSFYGLGRDLLLLGYIEVILYLIILTFLAEISLKRARKTGLVLKLSS
ncbi:MAG: ABC transporter permease [Archaeoglobaceae archaeon]|nr:ABC transporter permease [Archaeoglobaceae archaeon]MCX8151996.1 ABC transporter permease [Archaeoglobaceae archaeon]MDW8013385.1 ABC transporter permease [Archaeoglobaceae archaeon]